MALDLQALGSLAASASPMASVPVPVVPDTTLLVDGDGLAYYCAGNDATSPGEARANLIGKIDAALRITGAGSARILLTYSGSNKGHRYAVSRVKPYQGQRQSGRRPKNWLYLRQLMENDVLAWPVELSLDAEADDLFGWWAYNHPDKVFIYTQDKDMRMLPGRHLDWVAHTVVQVPYDLHWARDKYRMYNVRPRSVMLGGKWYGQRWFWMQMLHGDTADNVPGLPKYLDRMDGETQVFKPCGPVTAEKFLAGCTTDADCRRVVEQLYRGYYGKDWLINMIEQAVLLWMRRVPGDWDDCMNPGGPLDYYNDGEDEFARAYFAIESRIRYAESINAAAAQVNGDSEDA